MSDILTKKLFKLFCTFVVDDTHTNPAEIWY
jgi:hypothetical protein